MIRDPDFTFGSTNRAKYRQPGERIVPAANHRSSVPFRDADGRLLEVEFASKNGLALVVSSAPGTELLPGWPWTCLIDHEDALRTLGTQHAPEFTFPEV